MNNEDKNLDKYIHLTELIKKSIEKPDEANEELIELLSQNNHSHEMIDFLSSEEQLREADNELTLAYGERKEDELLKKIDQLVRYKKRTRLFRMIGVSVSIAALFFISFMILNNSNTPIKQLAIVEESNQYKKPTLLKGEKKIVEIESKSDKIILNNFTDSIDKNKVISYRLVIPHGQIYTVELCDGTNVTLNANSELIYPSAMDSIERCVEIKGEAFFDVAKSTTPFVVKANGGRIKVYGTTFNVNTRNVNETKTFLLSGSISFSTPTIKEIMLEPNQMIVANVTTEEYNITSVNDNHCTAWLTNYFVLYEASLIELLGNIKDWYNVDFEYSNNSFEDIKVSFSIKKPKTVNEMIEFVENIINIEFKEQKGGMYRIERRHN